MSWTRGYGLNAEYVFHARVPINKDPALSLQILKFIIQQIFELAEYWKVQSISLPALGTGTCKHTVASFTKALKQELLALESKPHYLKQVIVCELDKKQYSDVAA